MDARATRAQASSRLRGERPAAARPLSASFILIVALVLAATAWLAGRANLYAPGSDVGYYMGLVGSVMMLLLLLYPLRKRIGFLRRAGELRWWFRMHMFFGIAGPVLVMFHSTLRVGSLNAAVAFYSMVLVASSGVIGRFIYTKIHHGLYGHKATLQERQERLGLTSGAVKSKFHFAPDIEQRLAALEAYATNSGRSEMIGVRRFAAVALRAFVYRRQMLRRVRRLLSAAGAQRGWTRDEVAVRQGVARQRLDEYLDAVKDVAQFRVYERLFSLWHVLHVPLVYMLVICALVHVVAVHMY
ncbi:MAG TPA: hypothetical protein VFJ70_11240 [Burkholderiales bacterium]|nr:hypothetical protein [Burkholderiales bacterium]